MRNAINRVCIYILIKPIIYLIGFFCGVRNLNLIPLLKAKKYGKLGYETELKIL